MHEYYIILLWYKSNWLISGELSIYHSIVALNNIKEKSLFISKISRWLSRFIVPFVAALKLSKKRMMYNFFHFSIETPNKATQIWFTKLHAVVYPWYFLMNLLDIFYTRMQPEIQEKERQYVIALNLLLYNRSSRDAIIITNDRGFSR